MVTTKTETMDGTSILPVITLYQPWPSYIMAGLKTVETRLHDRFKCLEGKTVLIHAARNADPNVWAWENRIITLQHGEEALNKALEHTDVRGAIVGSAFVDRFSILDARHTAAACIDCKTVQRYGLFLSKVNRFDKPQYVNGSMGIWYYDIEKQEKVKKHFK